MPDPRDPQALSGDAATPRSRRSFLTRRSGVFLSLWGLGALGVVGAYLRPPDKGRRIAERIVSAGMLEALPVGDARLVRHGTTPFWVVRMDQTRVVALSAVCTHVRCILGFDRQRRTLVCPCHGGRFDLAGTVLSGPPPSPLPSYKVSVRAGEVFVYL